MANVTITVPDGIVPRLTVAMRTQFPEFASLGDVAAFKAATAKMWREVLAVQEGITAGTATFAAAQAANEAAADKARNDAAGIG